MKEQTFQEYCNRVRQFEKRVKALEQEPKWIPVSERLPKEEGSYMTTLDYGEYGLSVGQRFYYGKDYGWTDGHVIAWMPLPKDFSVERTRRF